MAARIPGLHKYTDKRTKRTYYSCIHPLTKKRVGLGTDRAMAARMMHRLKAEYAQDVEKQMWERIKGKSHTLKQFIDEKYLPSLADRDLAATTLKGKRHIIDSVLLPRFGDTGIKDIEVIDIADLLNEYREQDKNRMAQSIRSCFIDIFVEAISCGWTKENPAAITRNPKARIKRSRLTLEQFQLLYSLVDDDEPWLRRMMELAIVTSHAGATELANLKRPVRGENMLRIERTKTTERVKLPLDLTLDALGWRLGDIVEKCLSTRIVTPYLLHHTSDAGNRGKGKKMHHYRLTRRFTELVRKSGIDWGDKNPATLYEIRSLSERLYKKQGIDTQTLLAHKNKRSTERYDDARGSEWKVLEL